MTHRYALAWIGMCAGIAGLAATQPALAAGDCAGNPDALGVSRTLVVDPSEHPLIGTMQYAETLPLHDREVVLTFDDGPLPKYSDSILDILAAECVKATFFVVGRMAQEYPGGVRKLRDAGHTIGTHSQSHPLGMNHMPIEAARQDIDDGIAATTAALGGEAPAPFFRIPGLRRAGAVEDYLRSKAIQTWSADFPADDWRHIAAAKVSDLALSRIEAKGKGILLLHDIQARTVAALPHILRELKANGYRIVHVVPATTTLPPTPTEPRQWRMHPALEAVAVARWPAVPGFAFARSDTLPVPELSLGLLDGALLVLPEPFDRVKRLARGGGPVSFDGVWPLPQRVAAAPAIGRGTGMPMPAGVGIEAPDSSARRVKATLAIPAAPRAAAIAQAAENDPARMTIPGSQRVTRAGLHRVPLSLR